MRRAILVTLGLMTGIAGAEAKIEIAVNKDAQQMIVSVDGVEKYVWPVSSGNPSHETPNGSFRAFRMEEDHYSKEFDEAPMPHAIFFTKTGHAIHGTDAVNRLGSPASHGCVRLSRANAATLFAMVKADGVLNTTVSLTGSAQVALMRNPRNAVAARQAPVVRSPEEGLVYPGETAIEMPRGTARRMMPQNFDGYVYPAESNAYARETWPRGRGRYDAQGTPLARGYDDGYAPRRIAPRGYYYQD